MKIRLRLHAPLVSLLTATVISTWATPVQGQGAPHGQRWVGTWAAAQVALLPPEPTSAAEQQGQPPRINNQTVRQVVRVSVGGSRVRVAVANTFGTEPLRVGAVEVALSKGGRRIDASTVAALTFDGRGAATVEIGSILVSDPVDLEIPPLSDLAVDLYLPDDMSATTWRAETTSGQCVDPCERSV